MAAQPAFNPGDLFKASSATGYVLLLAALSPVFGTLTAIKVVQAVALVATMVVAAVLVRAAPTNRLFAALALLGAAPMVFMSAYLGMETTIVAALMLSAALALQRGSLGRAIVLTAFATWFRIEVMLLVVLLVGWAIVRERRGAIILYVWPVVVLLAIDLYLYDQIMPHAAGAKSLAYGHPWEDSIKNTLRFATGEIYPGFLLAALLVTRLVAVVKARRLNHSADLFFAFCGGVLCAWILGRSNLFSWYFALVSVPFAIGLAILGTGQGGRIFRGLALMVSALYLVLGSETLLRMNGVFGPSSSLRVGMYLDIGADLYDHCPTCSLATSEIGGLGYGFRGTVWDGFGLADPEALQFHPMPIPEERSHPAIGAIPAQYIPLRDPDFVVSMPVFSMSARETGVLAGYTMYDCPFSPDRTVRIFGDDAIEIYSKVELPNALIDDLGCSRG